MNRPAAAVALRYDGLSAPRVTVRAEAELAREMLAKAEALGIPVHRDAHLLALLGRVELDQEIPLSLFVAVAEVLAFAYRLKDRMPPAARARAPGRTIEQSGDDAQA